MLMLCLGDCVMFLHETIPWLFQSNYKKKNPFCEPQIVIMEAEHDTEYIYSTAMWAHLSGDILLHIVIELIIDFASFSGKFLIHDISFASRREHWKLLNLNRINLEKSELSNLAIFENFG